MIDIPTILAGAGGSVTTGGLALWLFKRWMNKVDDRFDILTDKINKLQLTIAENTGKGEGESKLVWREINTDKHKIADLQANQKKMWPLLQQIAAKMGIETKRVSDLIEEVLSGEK